MKLKKYTSTKYIRTFFKKSIAFKLIILHLLSIAPYHLMALTGGPSQPEVQSFEPVGTSNMVDLFSGDFNYNIPLLDVGGYPINISYHSGVTMDQEASWVGLGWNVNPGVINRNMRGIPDDFDGDKITKEFNMKPNRTFGLELGITAEVVGFEFLSVGYSIGVNYNNYNGIGMDRGVSLSLSNKGAEGSKGTLNASLGLNSSSTNGLSISPSLSYSARISKTEYTDGAGSLSSSIGISAPFNSRAGLKQISINTSLNSSVSYFYKVLRGDNKGDIASGSNGGGILNASARFDFGTPTFTPSVDLPMFNFSGTGRFTAGGELFGLHGSPHISGYFSTQQLITNKIENPAYGYMNSSKGQKDKSAILDFNREKDGAFQPEENANLPLTNFTYDLYSISGQGIAGSYRPVRNDIGYVFDPANYTTSAGVSIGVEIGGGNIVHGGGDIKLNYVNTNSGKWEDDNLAGSSMQFQDENSDITYEPFYFKDAGERTADQNPEWVDSYGNYEPVYLGLDVISKYNVKLSKRLHKTQTNSKQLPNKNSKNNRDVRSQVMQYLRNDEVEKFGLLGNKNPNHPNHHISEISVLQASGERYFYSIPAYNLIQKEVTFAVGKDTKGQNERSKDCTSGLVNYIHGTDNVVTKYSSVDPSGNSIESGNKSGLDNYVNIVTTPKYAHSYLLTAVVSSDYVDIDNTKGPSDNDLGNYTRFYYDTLNAKYKWRAPFNQANLNEGLKADQNDDKGSYIYGEKEIWYLDSIVTKNHIAIFYKSDRKDGYGANENGVIDLTVVQQKLDSIKLFSKPDYRKNGINANPLKTVHFDYTYDLCGNIPNNSGVDEFKDVNRDGIPENINAKKGKLTLKNIYFTYQRSNKARFNVYSFDYNESNASQNPDYHPKGYDRWGNYKPSVTTSCNSDMPVTNSEEPYVIQNKNLADLYTSAWTVKKIFLPSGGILNIEYESDDYAYVQHKKAMQMFKIVGSSNSTPNSSTVISNGVDNHNLSNLSEKNPYLIFEMQEDQENIQEYFKGIHEMYFKFFVNFGNPSNISLWDYVPGYALIDKTSIGTTDIGGKKYGYFKFKSVSMGDAQTGDYNPISKAAVQFGRIHLSRQVYDQDITDQGFGLQMLNAIKNSSFAKNITETVQGPNLSLWNNKNIGQYFKTNKSWVRLNNPNGKKLGGGLRVKKVFVSDEWGNMTQGDYESMAYGQEYKYTLEDGTSSGVASYEPMLGGEENPFRMPVYQDVKIALAPDQRFYKEEPFGESFFPGPSVGYSKIEVSSLKRPGVKKHATGKVAHEFYTYKEFPVITKRTKVDPKRGKSDPFSLTSLFKINAKDYLTATQGYYIELNDMNGKPKSQKIYQEDGTLPISSLTYKYKTKSGDYPFTFKVDNMATVIDQSGNTHEKEIGVFYDMVADFREQKTEMYSAGAMVNVDGFYIPPFFVLVLPMVLPSFSNEKTMFRSAVTTKVVHKFGLLEETIAEDLGSVVKTKNLAYDANSGDVLLTEVNTNYNDKIFSLKFPAYWYYKQMGHAYKNINIKLSNVQFNFGNATISNAKKYFTEGDELALSNGEIAWVVEVKTNSIKIVDKTGATISGLFDFKVIRSGNKNMMAAPMAQISTLSNPIQSIKTNIYDQVLQASAIEYSDEWRTYCDCLSSNYISSTQSNPYFIGNKGNWAVKRNQVHLSGRTQSIYNNNTNIRKDGMLSSYTPFYKLIANDEWIMDKKGWTFSTELTEFSPLGQELESRDALGRYSSSTYGYNGTLATAVAANAKYKEIGFDGFEDYDYNPCVDGHFKFTNHTSNVTKEQSHSGKHSIKVSSGSPVILQKDITDCNWGGCNLELSNTVLSSGIYSNKIEITGGETPYLFEYIIYSGSPTIGPISENSYGVSGTEWSIKFMVTDAKGCTSVSTFNKTQKIPAGGSSSKLDID